MPFVADEIVTAAKLNLATAIVFDSELAARTFTNTTFLDLDALTGGAGTIGAVSVTVTTGTAALVSVGAHLANATGGSLTVVSYRVSGATTLAASDDWSLVFESSAANDQLSATRDSVQTALTAGSNTFEVQARVSGGTGSIQRILLVVETVVG